MYGKKQKKKNLFFVSFSLFSLLSNSFLGHGLCFISSTNLFEQGVQLQCQSHISSNFELSLHEKSLSLQFSCGHSEEFWLGCGDGAISLPMSAFLDEGWGLFEVDGPLIVSDFEEIDSVELLSVWVVDTLSELPIIQFISCKVLTSRSISLTKSYLKLPFHLLSVWDVRDTQ